MYIYIHLSFQEECQTHTFPRFQGTSTPCIPGLHMSQVKILLDLVKQYTGRKDKPFGKSSNGDGIDVSGDNA